VDGVAAINLAATSLHRNDSVGGVAARGGGVAVVGVSWRRQARGGERGVAAIGVTLRWRLA